MPEIDNTATPGDFKRVNGVIKVALVGFDKQGDTCVKWYLPKTSAQIHKARRFERDGKL